MRSFLFFLVFAAALFFAGFGAARFGAVEILSKRFSEKCHLSEKGGFRAALYPEKKLPFCIAIIGRNNGAFLEKTIRSALFQSYEKFRVIYVDDGSDDGSFELAQEVVETRAELDKIQMIRNEEPLGLFRSLASVAQRCADGEIVVVLEGKDWLAHEWVLNLLNRYYADPDLWMTSGNTCNFPSYQIGKQNESSFPFCSFYARVFKNMQEDSDDVSLSLLEIAKGHCQALQEILCITPSLENR